MISVNDIQLNKDKKSLYESYYFRGNVENSPKAFWIKHNLLKFNDSPLIRVESTVILFDRQTKLAKSYKHNEDIPAEQFFRDRPLNWDQFDFQFSNGSHLKVRADLLQGKLITDQGHVEWDLKLLPSGQVYYHFSDDWFYHGFFPKKKILTKDIRLTFSGQIKSPEWDETLSAYGMNGHNWGTEHAYKYAYANCNQFKEAKAYFDGFSAKIALAGGLIKSPYLSCCSLLVEDQWFHFNRVRDSYKHNVKKLSLKQWEVHFVGSEYHLKLNIDGANQAWVSLPYDHPSRKLSTVNNTKFANGSATLMDSQGKIIHRLSSEYFELETLIP